MLKLKRETHVTIYWKIKDMRRSQENYSLDFKNLKQLVLKASNFLHPDWKSMF